MPPWLTSRSEATPSAGLAVIPEYPSDPPHCMPITSSDTGIGSRRAASALAAISSSISTPLATVARVPPVCWMVM